VWRLNQLRGISEGEAFVKGVGADTEPGVLDQLPTLIGATLYGPDQAPLGTVADAAVELGSGRILHYLAARSDPRLPGTSRWRLSPERIVDQQPGRVVTALQDLDDLPLARSSVRQEFLRRSRRWREQVGEETSRLRDQFQQVGDRVEERLEGWLEEPPWDGLLEDRDLGRSPERSIPNDPSQGPAWDPLEDWEEQEPAAEQWDRPSDGDSPGPSSGFRRASGSASADPSGSEARWSDDSELDEDLSEAADQGLQARSRRPPGRRPPARRAPEPSGSDRYRGRDDDDPWV
jgi:hypothetical protein